MSDNVPVDAIPVDPIVLRFAAKVADDGHIMWTANGHDAAFDQFISEHGMIEIPADVAMQLRADNADQFILVGGQLQAAPPPVVVPPPMAPVKSQAQAELSDRAEGLRLVALSGGSTMAVVYAAKLREADALIALVKGGGVPAAAGFPLLHAETGFTAATMEAVAAVVVARSRAIDVWLAGSEIVRLRAKAAIKAANTQAEVDAALGGVVWPALPG